MRERPWIGLGADASGYFIPKFRGGCCPRLSRPQRIVLSPTEHIHVVFGIVQLLDLVESTFIHADHELEAMLSCLVRLHELVDVFSTEGDGAAVHELQIVALPNQSAKQTKTFFPSCQAAARN